MREIRTLRATWRGLETWCGSGPRATPARQPSTLLMSGEGRRGPKGYRALPRLYLRCTAEEVLHRVRDTSSNKNGAAGPRSNPFRSVGRFLDLRLLELDVLARDR